RAEQTPREDDLAEFPELAAGVSRSEHGLHGDEPRGSQALARYSSQFATAGRASAAAAHHDYFRQARDDPRADAFDTRRSGPAGAALGHAPPARGDSRRGVYRAARSVAFDQLGAAGSLQPPRFGIHPKTLTRWTRVPFTSASKKPGFRRQYVEVAPKTALTDGIHLYQLASHRRRLRRKDLRPLTAPVWLCRCLPRCRCNS